jgi:hypothetical protein
VPKMVKIAQQEILSRQQEILVEVYCKGARLHACVSVSVREKAQPAILFCQQEILVEGMGERPDVGTHVRSITCSLRAGWPGQ